MKALLKLLKYQVFAKSNYKNKIFSKRRLVGTKFSFFPLQNIQVEKENRKFLDACAAPGGKSFQLLSKKYDLILNDKSNYRIQILKNNLKRLNFTAKILNYDFIKFNEKEKFDFIILDSPCSAYY